MYGKQTWHWYTICTIINRAHFLQCKLGCPLSLRNACRKLSFGWLNHVSIDFSDLRKTLKNFNSSLLLGHIVINRVSSKQHISQICKTSLPSRNTFVNCNEDKSEYIERLTNLSSSLHDLIALFEIYNVVKFVQQESPSKEEI